MFPTPVNENVIVLEPIRKSDGEMGSCIQVCKQLLQVPTNVPFTNTSKLPPERTNKRKFEEFKSAPFGMTNCRIKVKPEAEPLPFESLDTHIPSQEDCGGKKRLGIMLTAPELSFASPLEKQMLRFIGGGVPMSLALKIIVGGAVGEIVF
jgi:hypothetical protein